MAWFRNNQIQEKLVRSKLDFRGSWLCGPSFFILCLGPMAAMINGESLQLPTRGSLEGNEYGRRTSGQGEARNSAEAETLFRRHCSRCHDSEGRGKSRHAKMPEIPDFTNSSWQKRRSNSQLEVSILEGKGKSMPAFGDRLKDEEVQALVSHIRGFNSSDFAPAISTVSEFDRHYRMLQEELNDLRQQFRDLSGPARRPPKE